ALPFDTDTASAGQSVVIAPETASTTSSTVSSSSPSGKRSASTPSGSPLIGSTGARPRTNTSLRPLLSPPAHVESAGLHRLLALEQKAMKRPSAEMMG